MFATSVAVPRSLRRGAYAFLLAAAPLGCLGGGAAQPTETDAAGLDVVAVAPATVTVQVGATVPLSAQALAPDGAAVTGASLTFASSDTLVAAVDAAGIVRGVAAGSASVLVTAAHGGATRSTTVPVSVTASGGAGGGTDGGGTGGGTGGNVVTTSGASFVPATITIAEGASVVWQISGATHNVTFGANKPAGGDVPDTPPGGSATRVFAAAGTYEYQCTRHSGMAGTVVVQGAAAAVFTSVAVAPAAPSIAVGGTVQLGATPRDQNGSAMTGLPAATWASSSELVARVSASGLVTGVAAGTATITATVAAGGVTKTATATVTVTAPSASNATVTTPSLTFSPRTVTIGVGGTVTWQISGSTHNVTFGALKPTGGDVPDTDAGSAASRTFDAAGTYEYRCTRHDGMSGTVVVQGSGGTPGQFASLSLSPATAYVTPGGTAQLTATALDGAGAPIAGLGPPTFRSTNAAAATVSAAGLVTGIANGSALVIASLTADGVTREDTTAVGVGTPAATVTAAVDEFTPETVSVAPGGTVVWRFEGATHNVTFDEEQPPGGNIPDAAPGTSASRTFTAAGDYDYVCTIHAGMKGRVRVR